MKQRYTKLKSVALAALTMGLALGAQAAKNTDCITFTSKGEFSLNANGKGWDGTLYWSTDQENWKEWTWSAETPLAAAQAGGTGAYNLYLYGTTANTKITGTANYQWILTTNGVDTVACSGNIETLRGATGNDPSETSMANYCYDGMFYGCAALTAAPALPATTLAKSCYSSMFYGCTALTAAPALPAATLSQDCYFKMFSGCTSLTAVPALPATTLANGCYRFMFQGCTSLEVNTSAPGKEWKLPKTSESPMYWNKNMFSGIKSGSTVPAAPAQNTTYYIASAPGIDLGGGAKAYDQGNGTYSVNGSGTITKAGADLLKDKGVTNLYIGAGVTGVGANAFDGWRSLRSVEMGADCETVGSQAFLECFNLTNVTSKATGAVSVGDHAFYRCNSLESMDFGVMPTFGTQSFTLQAGIYMKDGLPQVYSIPDITIGGTSKRHVYGTVELGANAAWVDVTALTDEQRKAYHFFKIVAE